ncbi:hypothetical protein J31TS4_30080 [Paenibacillus sp. J31TS4]|uniref:glycerophosphodiester phosphodiesterase family protein n=1 Tax=Paenibacillus sp. J31TS4 TaxID=2807195 RepID=UPI001B0C631D|nr:glycerophosphodiester phosphodiesterase family protein [Paenibacillus sp. J31TS4]GIP39728.1 hypothetical protein J31TS4_30080 [Paenibacillus sp. J31TS4]
MGSKTRSNKALAAAVSLTLLASAFPLAGPTSVSYANEAEMLAPAALPAVVISEIMYDAPGSDDGAEYVEVSNIGSQAVDLSGYYIGDAAVKGSGEGMFQFPQGAILQAGQSFVIAQSSLGMKERYGSTPDYELPTHPTYNKENDPSVPDMLPGDWSTGYLTLAQAGDDVLLMDTSQKMVDYVPYGKDGKLNGKTYKAAPGITQHIQSLQRQFLTGDASIDFWPLPPTIGAYVPGEGQPRPYPGPAISRSLLISEVLYDAIHDEDNGEFIEITNVSGERLDISGYSIGDAEFPKFTSSGEGMFLFPEGTFIEPYQVIVVALNAKGIRDRYGVTADFELEESLHEVPNLEQNKSWATGMAKLGNAGDQALLYDRNMQIVDAVVWQESSPFPGVQPYLPTINANNGHSIERWNAVDTNNAAVNFVAQPKPSPGVLLFGPHADTSRIPELALKTDVLAAREPATGISFAPTVIGYGGDAKSAPENTRAAIEKLLETDASQIMLPVQMTSDGELIVFGDETLNKRSNGKGRVDKNTWAEISQLDAGSWFSPEFAGQRILKLSEALDLIQGKLIPVLSVESEAAALKTADLLKARQWTDAHLFTSEESILTAVKERYAELRGGLNYAGRPVNPEQLKQMILAARRSGAVTIQLDQSRLTADVIHYLRVRGLVVWGIGGDSEREAHDLIALGAGGLVTGDPRAALASLRDYPEGTVTQRPLIGGHRGSVEQISENTMPAFEAAWQAGVDLIETDVLVTKDGQLVLMHDDNVDRTTNGSGKIRNMTLAEIKQLNANYLNPSQPAEVPTLDEYLAWAKEKKKTRGLALFLEIKAPNIESSILELVKKYGLEEDVYLITFRLEELKKVRQLNKEVGLVYIHNGPASVDNPLGHAEKFIRESLKANALFNPSISMNPVFEKYVKHRGIVTFARPISDVANLPQQYSRMVTEVQTTEKVALKVGEAAGITGEVVFQSREKQALTPKLRLLDGSSEVIALTADNKLQGLSKGTAWVQAYYEYEFQGKLTRVYARPTEVSVK